MIELQEELNNIKRDIDTVRWDGNCDAQAYIQLLTDKDKCMETRSQYMEDLIAINARIQGFELYLSQLKPDNPKSQNQTEPKASKAKDDNGLAEIRTLKPSIFKEGETYPPS